MDPQSVLDEAEIRGVLIRERFYKDTSQWGKMRLCYHPNALSTLIDISWYRGDIDGFIHESEKMAEQGTTAIHTIQPVDITVKGFKAFAQSIGTISTRIQQDATAYDLVAHCRLLSRLQKVDATGASPSSWKMLSIEMIYVQDQIIPIVPAAISEQPGFLESVARKRKSYRLLSWAMEQKGYKINDELPGTDLCRSVKGLLDRNEAWVLS